MKTVKKNETVKAEGVFCGSHKYPQNVGNDDWADKAWFLTYLVCVISLVSQ